MHRKSMTALLHPLESNNSCQLFPFGHQMDSVECTQKVRKWCYLYSLATLADCLGTSAAPDANEMALVGSFTHAHHFSCIFHTHTNSLEGWDPNQMLLPIWPQSHSIMGTNQRLWNERILRRQARYQRQLQPLTKHRLWCHKPLLLEASVIQRRHQLLIIVTRPTISI